LWKSTRNPIFIYCVLLSQHGVNFNNADSRNKLLQLKKRKEKVNHNTHYAVNEIKMEHGYLPLCPPPYHPHLNLIEFVGGEIKNKLALQNNG
jgi:hypothetical protein